MSDEKIDFSRPTLGPAFPAHHTLMIGTVGGLNILFGQDFVTVGDLNTEGQVGLNPHPCWLASVHMSPTAARHMLMQLTDWMKNYERAFGAIPVDPRSIPKQQSGNVIGLPGVTVPTEEAPQASVAANTEVQQQAYQPYAQQVPVQKGFQENERRHRLFGLFDREAQQAHRPPSNECPPSEPEPSRSEPKPPPVA